jgi:Ca-activated chloride channel family protein
MGKLILTCTACVSLVALAAILSFPSSLTSLVETADAEIDSIDGEACGSPPERSWLARKASHFTREGSPFARPFAADTPAPAPRAPGPASALPPAAPPRSGTLSSTYLAGSGAMDHLAAQLDASVVIDGQPIALGALTATYHQPVAVPAGQALRLFANPEHRLVPVAGGTTHLQIGIQAASLELPRRPSVQLLLVLDVSGSMSGAKLEQARSAALGMLDTLAPTDEFGLVTYSDDATVAWPLGPIGDRTGPRAAILAAEIGGGTNLSEGLRRAYDELGPRRRASGISRVVLLSDGEPTQGITAPAHIQRQAWTAFQDGLQTTTLGVGVGFNSELMMGIAREGKGNYHFVDDEAQLARVLDEELDQLTHVVAQAVRLRIELPDEVGLVRVLGADVLDETSAADVRTEEVALDTRIAVELGIAADRRDDPEGGLKLLIPSMHMGRHHVVMLEVTVPPGADPADLARVQLDYKDLLARTNRSETVTATVERTANARDALTSLDPAVKKNLLGFQTGEAMLRAGALIDEGRPDEAVAVIDDQMVLLGVAAERWRDSDLAADVSVLGRYKDVLAARHGGALDAAARGSMSKALAYNGYKLIR